MSLLLVQSALLGSGLECGDHRQHSASEMSMPMPAGSQHGVTGHAAATMTMPASAKPSSETDESVPPCQQPWVPGGAGSCATMASCAAPALSLAQAPSHARERSREPVVRVALATPPSRADAPEPPPPKA